ncbi:hypothetical protein ACQKWADRAFT_38150 [Trichoderma austrokoningii]
MLSVDHNDQYQRQQHQYSNTYQNHHDFTFGQDSHSSNNSSDFTFSSPIFPSTELSSSNLETLDAAIVNAFSPDSMRPDSWEAAARFSTPKFGRLAHQRESSLSSLGSTGPASPFNAHIANPQIAVTDANGDGFMDMHSTSDIGSSSYYQLAKTMAPYSGFHHMEHSPVEMAYPVIQHHKLRQDRNLLPAPDFANGLTRSHPASVASSIAGDSPATPITGDMDLSDRRRQQGMRRRDPPADNDGDGDEHEERRDSFWFTAGHANGSGVPKLGRTMTDVYGDELYNPNFTITSSPQQSQVTAAHNDVFSQRINAANSQHLSTVQQQQQQHHSPTSSISRDMSPFRHGSPLAPSPLHDWAAAAAAATSHGGVTMNSQPPHMSVQDRHHHHHHHHNNNNNNNNEAQFFQQQMAKTTQPATPQTISPKDAVLEFNESSEEPNMPLFSSHQPINFGMDHMGRMIPDNNNAGQHHHHHNMHHVPSQVPQRYPFIAYPPATGDASQQLSSADSNTSGSAAYSTPVPQSRPAGASADGGTYTCTYHGCTLRFETPSLLQKHKREGHRQSHALGGVRQQQQHHHDGMTSSLLNSQAGPHRCDRVNPSTGKPCNTIFSRPYDLTRHEDTIHNAKKQKVHCNLCTEEKTFSRADALTRHYRVCHPDVELPGKHRRRGGA